MVPVGTIISKLSDTSPGQAWVEIVGQSLSKSDYPELYAEIGSMFGETATTFDLPDLSDSYLTGSGAVSVGGTAGANSLTLSVDQLPAHSHGVTDAGHSHGVTDPGHTHATDRLDTVNEAASGGAVDVPDAGGSTGSATTGVSVDSATTGVTIDNTGSGDAVDNRPKSLAVHYFIKARL